MSLSLGMMAQIRSMIFVAGEPIPYFWPMRAFIHHNPLHGLENHQFEDAVNKGKILFHGNGFLLRSQYQNYYTAGKIDAQALEDGVDAFLNRHASIEGVELKTWLMALLTEIEKPVIDQNGMASASAIRAVLHNEAITREQEIDRPALADKLCESLCHERTIYETLDVLFGTGIKEELDELVIKSCLDFFDEGQSVWSMPDRKKGFFAAWREVALQNARLFLRGRQLRETLANIHEPENVIVYVLERLNIPESQWIEYFRRELASLHGWTGFIRWRANHRHYHRAKLFPGDLVDYLAVRLTLALSLILERADDDSRIPVTTDGIEKFVREHPMQAFLRQEFYTRALLPAWAQRVEVVLQARKRERIDQLGRDYIHDKRSRDAHYGATVLRKLAGSIGAEATLNTLPEDGLKHLLELLQAFENQEGMIWLEAMEASAINSLMQGINLSPPEPENKRPFAQALFCIDTRSERLRRHLESVGDYQTFGIAGFFGVPVSFMELGKGSETHLCPVLLTPKNLVMEMSVNEVQDTIAISAMEKAVHELKESVLTPFVTVEAIGLLFGFDMVGKTLAPLSYNSWRSRLHNKRHHTHLLIDKLNRDQADSIVRAVQRAVIAKAVEHELEIAPELINDDLVRELREVAMGHVDAVPLLQEQLGLDSEAAEKFIRRLRTVYRINTVDVRLQMERLGRIGFSLEEQVVFVSQALHAIGLTENFSRFVLVVGHGSQSENNPYESALDCGACGGNLGLVNARIFSHMANKPAVRHRLKLQGIKIPDDTCFVPALHNTTTDEVTMHDLDLLPSSHPIYLDRLQKGLVAACRLCAQERIPELDFLSDVPTAINADKRALRNAMDWSQVRPEWGLSRNVYFIIGRRALTEEHALEGRAFLHSYDYRVDRKMRLLENILTGPLVVGQWINMEHYFSTVDNEHYGSGSKVYHNVAGRFGVMTGNLSDLRTGLPAQTVLANGEPYHEPMRLITVIEAPFDHVIHALARVASVRRLLVNNWIRLIIIDPETRKLHVYSNGEWCEHEKPKIAANEKSVEVNIA